jgi:hypothetical protein
MFLMNGFTKSDENPASNESFHKFGTIDTPEN